MDIGIGVSEDIPLAQQEALAQEIERAGLRSLWTNEASGRDALLVCQAWAAATSTLEVGIGVVPIWTRSPAQLAMATATLQETSGGRFLLGLGVSHPATMGPWHDAAFERPRTAAADTIAILRSLLGGEKATHEGVRSANHFRLRISPTPPAAPLYLAAMGPRMLALAGTDADGVLLNWSSPAEVERSVAAVATAATDAGRDADRVEAAAYVRVAVSEDRDAARSALASEVGTYCALPAYAAHFERQGFGATVAAVKAAYRDGGAAAVPAAIDDDVLGHLGWWGTPDDDPGAALDRYAAAGLDHLVARVVVVGDDPSASVRLVTAAVAGP